jgi:hypothetical protein
MHAEGHSDLCVQPFTRSVYNDVLLTVLFCYIRKSYKVKITLALCTQGRHTRDMRYSFINLGTASS